MLKMNDLAIVNRSVTPTTGIARARDSVKSDVPEHPFTLDAGNQCRGEELPET